MDSHLLLFKEAIESIYRILHELDACYVFPDKAQDEMKKIEDIFSGMSVYEFHKKWNKN